MGVGGGRDGGGGQGRIYGSAGQIGHMPRDPHQKGPRQNGPSSDLGQGRLAPPPKGPPPNGASLPPRKKCIWQLTSPLNISCPGAPTVLNPAQELIRWYAGNEDNATGLFDLRNEHRKSAFYQ